MRATAKRTMTMLTAVAAAAVFALPMAALAAGPGGGGGGGGGGGKGDLYSELVPLLRDEFGRPLMTAFETTSCAQPVSYTEIPGITSIPNPVNGLDVWVVPLMGETATTAAEEEEIEVCDPQAAYAEYIVEVSFGRLSVSRSPTKVLAHSLTEAVTTLQSSELPITVDHAGRLVYTVAGVEKTIDAPLENLAMDKRLQEYGFLTGVTLPIPITGYDFLDHAAAFFGAAADKPGKITADSIVYINPVLLTASTLQLPFILGDGVHGVDGVKYVNYGSYTYDRATTYPGCAAGFYFDATGTTGRFNLPLIDVVFGGAGFNGSNVNAFATRADDARAVGTFVHDAYENGMIVNDVDRLGESSVCDLP